MGERRSYGRAIAAELKKSPTTIQKLMRAAA
jgi:hypothetical protein